MNNGMPDLSVVIVSWNSGDELLACLHSLENHPPAVSWEAIVVDNGSSDGSIARLRQQLPWVKVISNGHNRGLAAANNQGLVASQAPFVLISNPDVTYGPGSVDALVDVLARRERAAFAIANLRYGDGTLQSSVGSLPSLAEALLGWRLSRYLPGQGSSRTWWHGWNHEEERPVGHGAEACYLVRRSAIAEIGLQDERFVLDWEGVDWSARVHEAGWQIWFAPQAMVTHAGGTSLTQVTGRWIASSHLGMYRYFARRWPLPARPLLAALIAGRALVKLAVTSTGITPYKRIHRDTES